MNPLHLRLPAPDIPHHGIIPPASTGTRLQRNDSFKELSSLRLIYRSAWLLDKPVDCCPLELGHSPRISPRPVPQQNSCSEQVLLKHRDEDCADIPLRINPNEVEHEHGAGVC